MKVCNTCGAELIPGDNWRKSLQNRHMCNECYKIRHRKYKQKQISEMTFEEMLLRKLRATLNQHKRRGFEVIGSAKEYMHTYTGECRFCKDEFDIFSGDMQYTGSLDIIDTSLPMTPDNVQWLCIECNVSKGKRNNQEFLEYILKIKDRLEELV